ncbi:MAG TPA: ribosome silencing factor [Aggregatilineales bacterium]|nr:ribosome silencing factor [Anaerolineales bacterium]HRE48732.1 ribosome silencing factor [Aggregatilineales bacterium]
MAVLVHVGCGWEALTESVDLARRVVDLIGDVKGEAIVLMDLRGLTVMCDYFVIGTANSDRQLNAIVEKIREEIKKESQILPAGVEGKGEDGWVLMDYGDVIVHMFAPQARSYYDLEGLWRDAPVLLRVQ